MRKITMTLSLMALILTLGFADRAGAAGAYVGTGLGWAFPNFTDDLGEVDEEGGFSWEYLHVGYNFTDSLGANLIWGQAAGTAEDDELDWTNDYIDINFRYTFSKLYLEAGLGSYTFEVEDEVELEGDPVLGYRAAIGYIIPLSSFYIAPEYSYHWAQVDDYEVGGYEGNDLGGANFGLLSVKIGYMFGG